MKLSNPWRPGSSSCPVTHPRPAQARTELETQRQQALDGAWKAIGSQTHGSVEQFGTWFPADVFSRVRTAPCTLDQVASLYGVQSS